MKGLIILSVLATAYAGVIPAPAVAPAAVSTSRVVAAPAAPSTSQFHKQDEFGNLAFGYANILGGRSEAGNTYGGRTGGFSYVDANGILQTRNYIADGLGFRVVASDLPVAPLPVAIPVPVAIIDTVTETPEVAAKKAEHLAAIAEATKAAEEA